MKIPPFLGAVALASVFTLQAVTTHAALINFDNNTDLTNNFIQAGSTGSGTLALQAASVGIGSPASGGVTLGNADRNWNLNTSTYDLSATGPGTFQISSYFKPNGLVSSPTGLYLGFSAAPTTNTTGGAGWFGMRLNFTNVGTFLFTPRTDNGNGTDSGTFTSSSANWYKFTVDIVRSATLNTFNVTGKVDNYGTNGITTPNLVGTYSASVINSALWLDNSANAGFRAPSGNGVGALDNFEVTAVPEPTTVISGLAIALVGLATMLRRRSLNS